MSAMRRITLAVIATLAVAGCGARGHDASRVPMQTVGAYRVGVVTLPDPPRIGENAMTVTVRESGGAPVRDAGLEVVVSMPAMGAMPYMESRGEVHEAEPGVYRVAYGLAMNGEWDVALRLKPARGAPAQAAYRISTNIEGVAYASGGASATAATGGESLAGAISIDPARRQSLGIRVEPIAVRDLTTQIRAAGRVTYDETHASAVSLKYSGWVRAVSADFTGRPVHAGETLFQAYSPELFTAQQEYLEAVRAGYASGSDVSQSRELVQASRQRLLLWDVPVHEIDAITTAGKPSETLPVVAPSGGVIVEKNVVQGSPFTAGQVLYRIARTDPVWVVASVFQMDLPLVHVGAPARIRDPYDDRLARDGRVSFIAPDLAADSRTGSVRIDTPNPRGDLRPGMFVDVELDVPIGKRLAVPESAVLPTGERRLVFVDLGDGRLAPREVRLGARAGGYYEVLGGLAEGERVVVSGNFLVAAESRLRSAAGKW
jgi:membrane fusion protein, copper/silver efflux system